MKRVRVAKGCDRKLAAQIRRLVLRLRLDRRKVYCEADGLLATEERCCWGCAHDCHAILCSHASGGCRECGYTGKRVIHFAAYAEVAGEVVRLPTGRVSGERKHTQGG